MFTGFAIGTGSFIYAINFGHLGLRGPGVQAPGTLLVFLAIKVVKGIHTKIKSGSCIAATQSNIYHDITDGQRKIKWINLLPLIINIIAIFGYVNVMTLGWRLAKQAGINQGIISTLLGFAGIFNMISFYFGFKEKTNCA